MAEAARGDASVPEQLAPAEKPKPATLGEAVEACDWDAVDAFLVARAATAPPDDSFSGPPSGAHLEAAVNNGAPLATVRLMLDAAEEGAAAAASALLRPNHYDERVMLHALSAKTPFEGWCTLCPSPTLPPTPAGCRWAAVIVSCVSFP